MRKSKKCISSRKRVCKFWKSTGEDFWNNCTDASVWTNSYRCKIFLL